ncbi:MAG: hypothetical protein GX310_11590 [Synergistaceae bacterium]|nr:hypothetical protein [Synergistaceae bacterium]
MNCAETLLRAANDEYGLGIGPEGLKMMAGFGGGMGLESNCCGALSGAVAAISAKFTTTKAHENPQVKELCKSYLNRFMEKHGNIFCGPLKERHKNEDEKLRCLAVVEIAARELEELMQKAKGGTI